VATYEEYMATPDPWKKAELVRGEILMRRPGGAAHGMAISALLRLWIDFSGERSGVVATRHAVGEFLPNLGVRYALPDDPDQVRVLSVAVYPPEQLARLAPFFTKHPDAFAPEPPALAVDNVFPYDTAIYTQQKVLDLISAGARTIWLLYPLISRIVIWSEDRLSRTLASGDTISAPPGFEGLSVAVDDLFDRRSLANAHPGRSSNS